MTIIFYDLPSSTPGEAWSPNTWKTRFCLNYKGLDYKTEWVEFPDIADTCKKLGIAATSKKADGSPLYTLPAIHDPATGVYLAESFAIAEYLDKTYPDKPSLFPRNTVALQEAFLSAISETLFMRIVPCLPLGIFGKLNPPSAKFLETRVAARPKSPQATPEEAKAKWQSVLEGLEKLDTWYKKSGGPFLLGAEPSWADFVVVSTLYFIIFAWGEDSTEWKDVVTAQNGRWGDLFNSKNVVECSNA